MTETEFTTTDELPPMTGPVFSAEDVNELGLEMCLRIWRRLQAPGSRPGV